MSWRGGISDHAPHLSEETKKELLESTPPHLRDARSKGIPTLGSGAIFPIDEESIKVPPFEIPVHWPRINGIDFGWDHPTAVAGCAWDRDGDVFYITKGIKKSGIANESLPPMIAASIRPWGDWIPVAWPHDGEKHELTGQTVATLFKSAGLNMLKEKATFEDGGNSVEAGLLDMLERMQTGRFKVFSTVTEWFDEFRLYHRKDGKIVKAFDDLISASRYALMMKRFAKIYTPKSNVRVKQFRPSVPGMGL